MRVLLVEDDEADAALLRTLLAAVPDAAMTVDWVRSAAAARTTLATHDYDAVLLDERIAAPGALDPPGAPAQRRSLAPVILLRARAERPPAAPPAATDYLSWGEISAPLLARSLRYAHERARLLAERDRLAAACDRLTADYERVVTERDRGLAVSEAARRRLAATLEHVPAQVMLLEGPLHVIAWMNPAARTALGHDRTGLPLGEALPELRAHGALEAFDRAYQQDAPLTAFEQRIAWRTHAENETEEAFLDLALVPMHDASGAVTGLLLHAVDRTTRVRAEAALRAAEQRLRTVVENAPIILVAYDRTGRQTLGAGAGRARGDARPDEVLGAPFFTRFANRPDLIAHFQRALAGEAHTATLEVGGAVYEVQVAPERDAGGTVTGVIAVAMDISERARHQREVEWARKAALDLAQLRSDFVAAVSHELRTPLTAILGHAELLDACWSRWSEPHRRAQIGKIVLAANRQKRLVEDLLLVTRLEAQQLPIGESEEHLPAIVDRAIEEVRATYAGQHLEARGPADTRIRADPDRLLHILENLLDNAAKHSPERSPVEVTWEPDGASVVLRVIDHGPGVPAQGREHLFTRFGRVPGSRSRAGRVGTGLGLYLSRQIAQLMGGDLDLERTGPGGSIFRLRLPLAAPSPRMVWRDQA